MKKAAIFALTLLFTVSLTACGSGSNETSLPKEGSLKNPVERHLSLMISRLSHLLTERNQIVEAGY